MRTATRSTSEVPDADPQKSRLYALEDSWGSWNENSLTLAQCRDYIHAACALFGVTPLPTVKQHNIRSMSWCICEYAVISLQAKGKNRISGGKNCATALHEAAHYIAFKLHGYRIQTHGPTFCGIYFALLRHFNVAPAEAIYASARKYKVRHRKSLVCNL